MCLLFHDETGEFIPLPMQCDDHGDCSDNSDETLCTSLAMLSQPHYHRVTALRREDATVCLYGSKETYPIYRRCIYDTTYSKACPKNEHLYHCDQFECPSLFRVSTWTNVLFLARKAYKTMF